MKTIFILMALFSLTGCYAKDAAKTVGDIGNSSVETINDTISRDKAKSKE